MINKIIKDLFRPIVYKIRNYNSLRNIIKNKKKHTPNRKIEILFFMQFPEMWNSEKSLFQSLQNDERFNITLICVPKLKYANNADKLFSETNEAYDFCVAENIKAINTVKNGKWINVKKFAPDYIFIQRPYDDHMPKGYKIKDLARIGLVCYIPYGMEFGNNVHIGIEYNYNLLNNFYMVFADCREIKEFIDQQIFEKSLHNKRHTFDFGYPRYDLISKDYKKNKCAKIFLWLPRWSLSDTNDKSHFFDYIFYLMEYFKQHKELQLIIRPHPLMFANFVDKGYKTEEEIVELKNHISQIDNIIIDTNKDYLIAFNKSDVLISDFTSLLIEYFLTDKPVIFCAKLDKPYEFARMMEDTFYYVDNKDDLIMMMSKLSSGVDEKSEKRTSAINKIYTREDEKIADKIVAALYNDYISN